MTRTYSLLIEGDESGFSAYVPELPTILVTGKSEEEITRRADEAIRLYWETLQADVSSTAVRKEIEVELPVESSPAFSGTIEANGWRVRSVTVRQ